MISALTNSVRQGVMRIQEHERRTRSAGEKNSASDNVKRADASDNVECAGAVYCGKKGTEK